MQYIYSINNVLQNKKQKTIMQKIIHNSNYNYRAFNQNIADNRFSGVNSNYTIFPDVQVNYPKPYMTGKCVIDRERKQIPFNIHKEPRLFSHLVND